MMIKYLIIIALVLLVAGLILMNVSVSGNTFVKYTCMNGELRGNVTCVFPWDANVNNHVVGHALVSLDTGGVQELSNGTVIAKEITYIPLTSSFRIGNETQLLFNVYNSSSKWFNITLPGVCRVAINATIIGSGYVSITILDNGKIIDYTPYTYSLFTTTYANGSINILVKPAIILSCPCTNTLVVISVNGTCIRQYNATVVSTAYLTTHSSYYPYRVYAMLLLIASLAVLIISLILAFRR